MSTEGSKREEKLEKGLAREGPGRGSAKEGPGEVGPKEGKLGRDGLRRGPEEGRLG